MKQCQCQSLNIQQSRLWPGLWPTSASKWAVEYLWFFALSVSDPWTGFDKNHKGTGHLWHLWHLWSLWHLWPLWFSYVLVCSCSILEILDCSIALHRAPGVESDYTIQHALEPQHPLFRVLVWCSHPVICRCPRCPRCPHPIVGFLACMVAFTRDSVSMFTQPSSCSRTARAGKHLRFDLFQLVAQMWNCGEVVWI